MGSYCTWCFHAQRLFYLPFHFCLVMRESRTDPRLCGIETNNNTYGAAFALAHRQTHVLHSVAHWDILHNRTTTDKYRARTCFQNPIRTRAPQGLMHMWGEAVGRAWHLCRGNIKAHFKKQTSYSTETTDHTSHSGRNLNEGKQHGLFQPHNHKAGC